MLSPPVFVSRGMVRLRPLVPNLLSLADQGTVSATRLLLSVLVGRALGAEELGHYALALTAVYLVEGIVETLATLPYTVFRHRAENPRAYAGSALLLATVVGIGVGLAGVAAAVAIGGPLGSVLLVLAAALPARALAEAARRVAFAHERVASALALDVGLAVILAGGALAASSAGVLTVPLAVGLYGLGSGIPTLVWLATEGRRLAHLDLGCFVPDAVRNWRFGRWVLGTRLTLMGRAHGIPWLLAAVAGASQVGLLDAAGKIAGLAVPVLISVANVLTPRVARAFDEAGPAGVRRVVLRTTGALVVLTAALVVTLTAGADLALGTLYGADFTGHQALVGTIGLGLVMESIGIAADAGLWAIDRPHVGLWIGLAAIAVLAAVGAWSIPAYGALGAAIAMAAASATGAALQLTLFLRMTRPAA